ncbi:MAG: TrmH family RNA methyltransferase [Dethiobacteria bacterium]|jgi:TrmH family RNA methyltransferase
MTNPNYKNKIVQEYRRLGRRKYRKKSGKIILEGYHLLNEALVAGIKIETVFFTAEFLQKDINQELLSKACSGIRLVEVTPRMFQAMAQTENPQGIGAIAFPPQNVAVFPGEERKKFEFPRDSAHFYLILDELQDPGNLGTIIRTAAAAAINGIFLLPGTVEPYNPKALRASMGGIFYLPVIQVQEIDSCLGFLREQNMQLVAADPRGDRPYHMVNFSNRPSAVIIGNESRGVSKSLLKKADIRAYIPLQGKIAALNAAVASSVFIFESQRQKNHSTFAR